MKIIAIIIFFIFFFLVTSPDNAFAGTRVTVYFAGGVVIGGVSIFFSVLIGDRHHSKNEKKDNEDNPAPVMQAFNYPAKEITEDEISQAGMVKILEW